MALQLLGGTGVSEAEVKALAEGVLGTLNVFAYKGAKDCSANPKYPAASAGETYMVSVAGKIGGASGTSVDAGDLLLCNTDGAAEGTQAEVGAKWDVVQTNLVSGAAGEAGKVLAADDAFLAGRAAKSDIEILNLGTDWSAGDNQNGYSAVVLGQRLSIKHGKAASPDTVAAPSAKVVRTSAVTQATINTAEGSEGSDGGDVMAALMGVHVGTAASGSQTVGVAGFAKNASTVGAENPDACGIYGVGRITGGTAPNAGAFGAYLVGRRDVNTANACGAEIQAQNYTETAGSYTSNGSSNTKGIWLNANGNADSGVGIQIQNAFGVQFKVGIGFGNQVKGEKTGGVADSSIRDDSHSTTSLDIRGEHTLALKIGEGAGPIEVNGVHAFLGNGLTGQLAPHGTSILGSVGVVGTANRAYFARFVATKNLAVTKIAFVTTVAATNNDACDVGIFDATGKRLVSAGATSGLLNATAGAQVVTVAETKLVTGKVYYAAFSYGAVGGTAATIAMTSAAANIGDIFGTAIGTRITGIQATAHPLAETATLAQGNQVPVLALRSS